MDDVKGNKFVAGGMAKKMSGKDARTTAYKIYLRLRNNRKLNRSVNHRVRITRKDGVQTLGSDGITISGNSHRNHDGITVDEPFGNTALTKEHD